jgi:hypothetical protein
MITFVSFLISFYTCKLVIDVTGDDPDFSDTMLKYYGNIGFYSSLIAPAILVGGAVTVYFVIMA